MKTSIWHLTFVLLVGCGLASVLPKPACGQDTQSAPTDGSATVPSGHNVVPPNVPHPGQHTGQATNCVIGQPPAGHIVESEEVMRYEGFFMVVRGWDDAAKSTDATGGDHGMAEAWRTRLKKQSGLTSSEADEVKKIAYQYLEDDAAWAQRFVEAGYQARTDHPNAMPGSYPTPEIDALRREHIDLVNKAIANLVTTLGSRSFSRLDLFTRHMDDWLKNSVARQNSVNPFPCEVK